MSFRIAPVALVIVAAAAVVPGSTLARGGSTRWESIETLAGHTPVSVLVNDNARGYFRVTNKAPLAVPFEGPALLRVVSRVELPRGSAQAVAYHLIATENGKTLDQQDTESSAADRVHLAGDGSAAIGKSRRWSIDVPPGRHTIAIQLEGVGSALLRLHRGTTGIAAGTALVTLTPVDAPRSVNVTEGEKTIPYFTTLVGKPVRYRVVGPVALRLTTRLDFDTSMRGTQNYALRVREGARPLRDLAFKTTKAVTAIYSNLPDRVPSKYDRATINVPAGTHELLVELLRPAGGAAEVHAAIPQPTTGGEE